jgi:hypothetical protein
MINIPFLEANKAMQHVKYQNYRQKKVLISFFQSEKIHWTSKFEIDTK